MAARFAILGESSEDVSMVNPPETPVAGQQERTWAMLCHLSALAGLIIPFGNIIGPLVVWLVKKEEMPIVNTYGKEALNFQISWSIYMIGLGIIASVLSAIVIGVFLFPIIGLIALADLVLVIIASVQANKGVAYKYPFTLHLIN
jgi:uncharacterized Tic20 family protein